MTATSTPTRRDVLRTAGIVVVSGGAVLTLAVCGAEGQAGGPIPTSAAPSSAATSASPSAPASDSGSPSPSASASEAPSGPSVATADVPVGGGVILDRRRLRRDAADEGDVQGVQQDLHAPGLHGRPGRRRRHRPPLPPSEFSVEDGSVKQPPASKPLPESATTVAGSKVYVTG